MMSSSQEIKQLKAVIEKAKSGLNAILWSRPVGKKVSKEVEAIENIAKHTLLMIDSECAYCQVTAIIETDNGDKTPCFQCANKDINSCQCFDANNKPLNQCHECPR